MITFKEYLVEKLNVLNPKDESFRVLRQVYKTWNKERYKQLFVDFKDWGFVDKRSMRLYFPLSDKKTVTPPNNDVVDFVKSKGYEILDYNRGLLQKSDSKGKLVTASIQSILSKYKQKELYAAYLKDPHHVDIESNKSSSKDYMVVISRHPYDIMGMSTGRSWRSCMNLVDGDYRDIVPIDVKEGSLVAYLIKATDKDIQDPVGRLTIRPYLANGDEIVLGVSTKGYYESTVDQGIRGLFYARVSDWVDAIHDKQKLKGVFLLKAGLYERESEPRVSIYSQEYLDSLTDDEKFFVLTTGKHSLSTVELSEYLQMKLVTIDGDSIQHILRNKKSKPTEKVLLTAVGPHSTFYPSKHALSHILAAGIKPSEKVLLASVESHYLNLVHMIQSGIKPPPSVIKHIKSLDKIESNDLREYFEEQGVKIPNELTKSLV